MKTSAKGGIESGIVNADALGDGLLLRAFFKYDLQKKFEESILNLQGRVSPDFLRLDSRVTGLKLAVQGDYLFKPGGHLLFTALSARQEFYTIGNSDNTFRELQGQLKYSIGLSNSWAISLSDQLIFRSLQALQDNKILQNRFELSADYKTGGWQWGIGPFIETADYENVSTDSSSMSYNRRIGPQFKVAYQRHFIINLVYRYGLQIDKYKADHQVSVIAGRYLSKKVSLFVFWFYLFKDQSKSSANISVFNSLSSANSFSAKLGLDVNNRTHLYLKISHEDQEIMQANDLISTWQGLLGLQRSF